MVYGHLHSYIFIPLKQPVATGRNWPSVDRHAKQHRVNTQIIISSNEFLLKRVFTLLKFIALNKLQIF
ncbi:MAG: hypothetical protein RIQ94_2008 [Pseudomonadota bacterium]|jgi:hypothetical protein